MISGLFGLFLSVPTFAQPLAMQTESEAAPPAAGSAKLPVGKTVYKVALEDEGIYEVSASTLLGKGFASGLNPAQIQVIHNGNAISWELVSDSAGQSNVFDADDKIRFYGWPFDESREEKLFVNNNVYWIVPGESAAPIQPSSNIAPTTPVLTNVETTIQFEVDDHFDSMFMVEEQWEAENAEPDHYFWMTVSRPFADEAITETVSINLPHPTNIASDATFEAIAATRGEGNTPAIAKMTLPDGGDIDYSFSLGDIFSLSRVISNQDLSNGENTISFTNTRKEADDAPGSFFVNYLNVTYQQDLKGTSDFLSFSHAAIGDKTYEISNFSAGSASELIIWDVSTRETPRSVAASSAGGGAYTFSANTGGTAKFVVAAAPGIRTIDANAISSYTVQNIEPADGYADWLAISYGDFIDVAATSNDINGLATHRASFSDLKTHVVDIEDVINQFGYGFPTSLAVKTYLQHAYTDWDQAVRYVLLVGDGHYNPRHLACTNCGLGNADFNTEADSLIPINYSYTDPNQGLIPSDYRYSLLAGDDLIPDIGIGRITAETTAQVQDAVSKIILYENNLLSNVSWKENVLFAHDWPKGVSDNYFRVKSELAEDKATSHGFKTDVAGLNIEPDDTNDPAAIALRQSISQAASDGLSLLVWRGHGSISNWSDGDVMSVDKVLNNQLFANLDKPFVSITHNCLDGNFAYPGWEGLGETLVNLGEKSTGSSINRNTGSAAHFSATGLGYVEEHEVIADYMFEAFFEKGLTQIGDAITYTKAKYIDEVPGDPNVSYAQLYNYNLLGDPAMAVFNTELTTINGTPDKVEYEENEDTEFNFVINNLSDITAAANGKLTFTIPKDINYHRTTVSYTGPNNDGFNFPSNSDLEPYTLVQSQDSSGKTVITISLHKLLEENGSITGGIPADGAINIKIYGRVISQPTQSFVILPYTYTSPGNTNQSRNLVINLGGAQFIYLPAVKQ